MASMKDLLKDLKQTADLMERQSNAFGDLTTDLSSAYKLGSDLVRANADAVADMQKTLMGASKDQATALKLQAKVAREISGNQKEMRKIQREIERARQAGDDAEIERLNYRMAEEFKQTKRIMDYRTQKIAEQQTQQEEQFKAYQDLMNDHKKNRENFAGFMKNMGGMAKGGDVGGMASGGLKGMQGILKSLEGVGGKLGKVAGAVGLLVGGLAMFVEAMFQADKAAKEMNKSFLKGASGLDLMNKNFQKGDLTNRLYEMREMAYDVGMQFRMSAGEVADLASSFNQFGLRYDEMSSMVGGTRDPVVALEANLGTAIRKSKMLGVEASTVAETMAQMNENFAMDLSQIDEAFTQIYMSAQTTGIATQKFFAQITQATGGLSLLNVDFAQTAAIAGELVEALGEAASGKFLQDLANRGRNMSYQDRVKSAYLSGSKTSRISKKGVQSRARRIQNSEMFKGVTRKDAFRNQMELLGIDFDPNADLMEQLGKLSKKDKRSLVATMGNKNFGGDPALERQMRELVKLQGTTGKGGPMNSAVQMGMFNAGENLAQMLAEASRFANLEKGESLGGMDRMVLENITGRSGGDLDEFVTMVDKLQTNMSVVRDYGEEVKSKGLEATAKAAGFDDVDAFQKMLKEEYKLALGANGELMSSETGEVVKSVEDYAVHMGDSLERIGQDNLSLENAMSSEIVKNTASVSVILENKIAKILNKISGFVEGIFGFLFDREKSPDAQKTKDKLASLGDTIDDLYKQRESAQQILTDLGTKGKQGKLSKKEKDMMALAKQTVEDANDSIRVREKQRQLITTGGFGATLERRDAMSTELRTRSMERLAARKKEAFSEEQKIQQTQRYDQAMQEKAAGQAALDKKFEEEKAVYDAAMREEYLKAAEASLKQYSQAFYEHVNNYAADRESMGARNQMKFTTPLGADDYIDFSPSGGFGDWMPGMEGKRGGYGTVQEKFQDFQRFFEPITSSGYVSLEEIIEMSSGGKVVSTSGGDLGTVGSTSSGFSAMMGNKQPSLLTAVTGLPDPKHFNMPVLGSFNPNPGGDYTAGTSGFSPIDLDTAADQLIGGGAADELEVMNELTDKQYTVMEQVKDGSIASQVVLDDISKESGKAVLSQEELTAFTKKKLSKNVGEEVMKAMVAEKLFDVAAAAGVDFNTFMERMSDPNKSARSYITSGKNWANMGDEKAKYLGIMDTLKVKDGYWDGTTMQPMGEGALVITSTGAYETKGDDKIAIGTNLGGSGSGGSGEIVIKGDIVLKGVQDPRSFGKQLRAHFKDRRNKRGKGV